MVCKVFEAFWREGRGAWGGRKGRCIGAKCRRAVTTLLHIVDEQGIVPRSPTHEPEFGLEGGKRGKAGKGGRVSGGESENEGRGSVSGTLASEDIVTIATQRSILRSPFEPEVPCVVNGARHTCFLFARPFSRQQTEGLLSLPRNVLLS